MRLLFELISIITLFYNFSDVFGLFFTNSIAFNKLIKNTDTRTEKQTLRILFNECGVQL